MVRNIAKSVSAFSAILLLGSCSWMEPDAKGGGVAEVAASPVTAPAEDVVASPPTGGTEMPPDTGVKEYVKYGSGQFVRKSAKKSPVTFVAGEITLNFEKTDIQEVVKVIIGDLLHENYAIGPGVTGMVSLQTSRPVGREMLLPMLENLLRMNGAALVRESGLYRVNAVADAARGSFTPSVSKPRPLGYQILVVPLRYVTASEVEKVLKSVVPEEGLLLVDDSRNLLMLAGSSQELSSWVAMIELFDVDWMRSYSVGLFPLENSSAKVVAQDLDKVLLKGHGSGLGKMVKIEPIERLNALLVISPQAKYLSQVKDWITRLDTVGSEPGRRLYVYQVKNRKAVELAGVVNDVFGGQSLQPKSAPVSALNAPAPASEGEAGEAGMPGATPQATASARRGSPPPSAVEGLALPEGADIRIVADAQNNAILVMATGAEYRIVEAALRKLDVLPLQVLVEASIMEVTLSDELSYGLEWYLNNRKISSDISGSALLDLNAGEGIAPIVPGFSYAVVNAAEDVKSILNMLATESKLNVLSSPSLMVLDNSKAKIRVGEQVPVRSSGERSLGEQTIYETFDYKDTGVMLSVTPRVNSGGLVTMEIDQTITDIGAVESTTLQRRFLQRNINSEVAIQSGQTVVLGGLILESQTDDSRGIPGLRDIPLLGWLFGASEKVNKRTELLVLITPKVISNQQEAGAITEEFKQRMEHLKPEKAEGEMEEEGDGVPVATQSDTAG